MRYKLIIAKSLEELDEQVNEFCAEKEAQGYMWTPDGPFHTLINVRRGVSDLKTYDVFVQQMIGHEYGRKQDPVVLFVASLCLPTYRDWKGLIRFTYDSASELSSHDDFYERYESWCEKNRIRPLSKFRFFARLKHLFPKTTEPDQENRK